ncbi:MAG: hypothetical protein LC798_03075 [Chloroflexi bacterium]|nr:hypothetical protein [Chloroflexota bacterium]
MSLVSIGWVTVAFHGDPKFSWVASPTSRSGQDASISGLFDWIPAHQLREMVANTAAQRTIGGATGVLGWIEFDDDLLGPMTGYYLLSSCVPSADQQSSIGGAPVELSISAHYLGDVA